MEISNGKKEANSEENSIPFVVTMCNLILLWEEESWISLFKYHLTEICLKRVVRFHFIKLQINIPLAFYFCI